jgi:hypothetical protein
VLSESARMSTAAELRFRVQAPNSKPRVTAVIALDLPGETFVRRLSHYRWNRATFLKAPGDDPSGEGGWLTTFDGRRTRIADEVHAADQVIMVATAGGHAHAAEAIGRACSLERVTTTALIIGAADASDDEISRTLAQLRPWSLMVVIASTDDYVADMMTALRV